MKWNKWLAGMMAMVLVCQPICSNAGEGQNEVEQSPFMQSVAEEDTLEGGSTDLLDDEAVDGDSEANVAEDHSEEEVTTLDTNEATTTEIVDVTEEVSEPSVETVPDTMSEIESDTENATAENVETDATESVAMTEEVLITESPDATQTDVTESETSSEISLEEKVDLETEKVEVPATEEIPAEEWMQKETRKMSDF